jgi:hypothetical protein
MADFETISSIIGLPNNMVIHQLDPNDQRISVSAYTVLVNPESYSVNRSVNYEKEKYLQSGTTTMYFNHIVEEDLTIQLLFDATGSLGNVPLLAQQNVLDQINFFLSVAFVEDDPKCGKPKPLQLIWGPMEFNGLLESVNITYSHFDATGFPIRATANCVFTGGSIKENYTPKVDLKKSSETRKTIKVVDYAKQKHAINAVLKYGSYVAIVAQQPRSAMPKSLRIAEQVAKLIIR